MIRFCLFSSLKRDGDSVLLESKIYSVGIIDPSKMTHSILAHETRHFSIFRHLLYSASDFTRFRDARSGGTGSFDSILGWPIERGCARECARNSVSGLRVAADSSFSLGGRNTPAINSNTASRRTRKGSGGSVVFLFLSLFVSFKSPRGPEKSGPSAHPRDQKVTVKVLISALSLNRSR